MRAAACATSGLPPHTWDATLPGEGGRSRARRQRIATAIAVCAGCPILEACGQLADARRDIGVWGGRLRPFDPARIPIVSGLLPGDEEVDRR